MISKTFFVLKAFCQKQLAVIQLNINTSVVDADHRSCEQKPSGAGIPFVLPLANTEIYRFFHKTLLYIRNRLLRRKIMKVWCSLLVFIDLIQRQVTMVTSQDQNQVFITGCLISQGIILKLSCSFSRKKAGTRNCKMCFKWNTYPAGKLRVEIVRS